MRAIRIAVLLGAAVATFPAAAQAPDFKGASVTPKGPGKGEATRIGVIKAEVVSLDKLTRAITLKGPRGNTVDVMAGKEVKNFDELKPGDAVVVRYTQALALELQKAGESTPRYGERPTASGREVRATAKVTAVDPKAKTISLTGPRGNTVTLDVRNFDPKAVKVGDAVQVTYTEAVAFSVQPAKKN